MYENIKSEIRRYKKVKDLDQKDELLAAAITGGITAFITTPLDLVKTKLMIQVIKCINYINFELFKVDKRWSI